ncbi:MAG: LamG domain-containing protein [Chroococcidiopsidaceae cyanobacterium CP_BM_RX_35]|nr:LamG domain-containing protein [Chroococcidiopsidaceae cyanobacterium CP_BM_RX_35]
MQKIDSVLVFDGIDDYIEISDSPDFSVATTDQLAVSAWIRPDVLTFPIFESTGYVHWMGKGDPEQREWVFRMYNEQTTDDPPRPNRISFYVFNLAGGEGIGSYFQEPVTEGEWIHVVGTADGKNTTIYKNGNFKDCDQYTGSDPGKCHNYPPDRWIVPQHGNSPLRIGTRDLQSFFLGAIREVRVWNRALTVDEVGTLYTGTIPKDGLVAEYLLQEDVAVDSAGSHVGSIFGATWVANE